MIIKIKNLLKKADVDRPVAFGILQKVVIFIKGPISAILIATQFSPETQGYFYTFQTIIMLQVFVELGLGTAIIQFTSHEWSSLGLNDDGKIVGDSDSLSRLISIAQLGIKWFLIASVIIIIGIGIGGYLFFSSSPNNGHVSWVMPWFCMCIITGINICFTPVWSILEGCNQVASLYTYRFILLIIGCFCFWAGLLLGFQLWVATLYGLVTLICGVVYLRWKYLPFCKAVFLSKPQGPRIEWRTHIFPMQWRLAVSWISGYFGFNFFTPILFKFHGPVVAGQFGMTWNVIRVIGTTATAWLSPRVPTFGMLIAKKKYFELDKLFWKILKTMVIILTILSFLLWAVVYIFHNLHIPVTDMFSQRILSPLPTALFLFAQILTYSSMPCAAYMRAHKREPIMWVSVLFGVTMILSNMILGKLFSALGMAAGYLFATMTFTPFVYYIWYRFRRRAMANTESIQDHLSI